MTTISQNDELLKQSIGLLKEHRASFRQERVFQRVALLVVAEFVPICHSKQKKPPAAAEGFFIVPKSRGRQR